jgi:cytochrome c biogenesis protein CcdA
MLLIALAYLGGVLTILSPCILPVLPFVFARADQPFAKSGLPLLAGMALTFALVASLAPWAAAGWWPPMNTAAGWPWAWWRCLR